ncbi:MAG: glycosyltransferase, partial [Alphaproteobacteria bacterium]
MKLRILINAMHTHTGGGVTYLLHMLPYMVAEKGWECTVLAPKATLAGLVLPKGMEVWEAPEYGFVKGHLWEQLVLPWVARRRGFKAVLCNANFVPLLAPRPMPILHTTTTAGGATGGTLGAWYWRALKVLTVLGAVRAPLVFGITTLLVEEFTPWPLRWMRRKAVVVPPGVEVAAVGKLAKQCGLVLAVGDFYAQKDYPTLLRALAVLRTQRPDVRLEIVGRPVYAAVDAEMKRLISELKLDDVVTLRGPMPHDVLLARMAEAEVFVSASKVESFNIPLVESMAVGTPVVCVDAPYVAEVVGEGDDTAALVVKGGEGDVPAALAVAMFGVMETPSVRDVLVRRGLARAKRFAWDESGAAVVVGVKRALG